MSQKMQFSTTLELIVEIIKNGSSLFYDITVNSNQFESTLRFSEPLNKVWDL
jgi:hypothetical protein